MLLVVVPVEIGQEVFGFLEGVGDGELGHDEPVAVEA